MKRGKSLQFPVFPKQLLMPMSKYKWPLKFVFQISFQPLKCLFALCFREVEFRQTCDLSPYLSRLEYSLPFLVYYPIFV